MKSKIKFLVLLIVVSIFLLGCASLYGNRTGTLPVSWWQKDIGEVENYYKDRATGIEKSIKVFIALDDSSMNIDRGTALENARLDAAVQLSRYLSQKVTNVMQVSQHVSVCQTAVSNGEISQTEADKILRKVDERLSSFSASVTNTQFSSFKEIGQHTEQDGNKYVGYVCYSMSDQILEETRKLQNEAFKTLMDETEEYKEIMQEIQEVIAESMKENIKQEAQI